MSELLARNLGVSKTAAVRLMAAGRVRNAQGVAYVDRRTVIVDQNGNQNVKLDGVSVNAAPPTVMVDERTVALWSGALVMLHKPVGVVTALRDNIHDTAYDLLREAPLYPELRAAGRLDLDTSGLLLWTTDGALIQRLTHPKRRVPRTYHAALARPFEAPSAGSALVLEDGHRPEILELRVLDPLQAHPALIQPAGGAQLATVTIVGGAYHEVRRLFAALGSHVLGLCRTRFGDYTLPHDLAPGRWRLLHGDAVLPPPPQGAR